MCHRLVAAPSCLSILCGLWCVTVLSLHLPRIFLQKNLTDGWNQRPATIPVGVGEEGSRPKLGKQSPRSCWKAGWVCNDLALACLQKQELLAGSCQTSKLVCSRPEPIFKLKISERTWEGDRDEWLPQNVNRWWQWGTDPWGLRLSSFCF